MPSTGIPSSSSSGSSLGAPSAYTDAGPPDRISPFGARLRTSSTPTWCGSSSENTPHSRTRRAMSCEYWPPKSRTTTSSTARGPSTSVAASSTTWVDALLAVTSSLMPPPGYGGPRSSACGAPGAGSRGRSCLGERLLALGVRRGGRAARAHPDPLRALQLLALGLQRRSDHQLGPVELRDVAVAARGHRRPQPAHEVERPVVLVRGADEDLLERAVMHGLPARAARGRRVDGRHAPGEPAARRLVGARGRRADHPRAGAARDGFGPGPAVAHAAVGDHLAVLAGL